MGCVLGRPPQGPRAPLPDGWLDGGLWAAAKTDLTSARAGPGKVGKIQCLFFPTQGEKSRRAMSFRRIGGPHKGVARSRWTTAASGKPKRAIGTWPRSALGRYRPGSAGPESKNLYRRKKSRQTFRGGLQAVEIKRQKSVPNFSVRVLGGPDLTEKFGEVFISLTKKG